MKNGQRSMFLQADRINYQIYHINTLDSMKEYGSNTMESPKKWLKLTLPCPEKMTEPVSDLMGILSGAGVDIHPVTATGKNDITGFFALDNTTADEIETRTKEELEPLFSIYNQSMPELTTEIIDDQDWATSWQQYFEVFEIIPGLVIKPSWENYSPNPRELVIEMDPGMAFGTGQHESTRMALLHISSTFANTAAIRSVLDVGTGTGILAMAAALYGADQVLAVDNDPEAVSVAQKNVANNKLEQKITVSGTPISDIRGPYDLICANIVHDVLVDMAPYLKGILSPGGKVILSGILGGTQEINIAQVYENEGMHLIHTEYENEWASLLLGTTS